MAKRETLVRLRDAAVLADALATYIEDVGRRDGAAGRARVLRDFRQEAIWEALHDEYQRQLALRGVIVATSSASGRIEDLEPARP